MLTTTDRAVLASQVGGRLYHVTPSSRLPVILEAGLRPGQPSQFARSLLRPGCVYLCTGQVALWTLTGRMDAEWGNSAVSVAVADLDPRRIVADEEYWRGPDRPPDAASLLARFPEMDSPVWVMTSARDAGTLAYLGDIPASALRVEFAPPRMRSLRAALEAAEHWGTGLSTTENIAEITRAQPRMRAWRRFKAEVVAARG
jgi:hypothetical protein